MDLIIKHDPVEEPQTVVIQVVRTDSDGEFPEICLDFSRFAEIHRHEL